MRSTQPRRRRFRMLLENRQTAIVKDNMISREEADRRQAEETRIDNSPKRLE
jgi:hypothetical protein